MRAFLKLCGVAAALLCLVPALFSCSEQGNVKEEAGGNGSDTREENRGIESKKPGWGGEATSASRTPETQTSLVPVAHLSSLREGVSMEELAEMPELATPEGSLEAARELTGRSGFRTFESESKTIDHVARTPGAFGLVPWDEVGPRVKALAVEGESLMEPGESDISGYPLRFEEGTGPDPEELRRIVIGGDIVLDRGQNYMVLRQGAGIDFPMDGGYAAITGRALVPNPYSPSDTVHEFTAVRTGRTGAVRDYLSGADLTLANFENPVVENAVYHPEAATFTGDLRLMPVLDHAGIDGVTLGNNHILDAGTSGLAETLGHLDRAGIARAGAGMDIAEARKPMIFDLGGTRIGVLSHLSIPGYEWAWATETTPGTAPLLEDVIREDVERLRPRVDLVVVMPHWGVEYIAEPEPGQVELAHAAVDAGADLVVGGHAHVPKGIEMYRGSPIYYGVGNFLLDQSWSEETSTGIFAEITLHKDRVVQMEPKPFVLLDYAQPNFLVPESGGDRALRKIYAASRGPEFENYGKSQ